jgi:hypothetical protein
MGQNGRKPKAVADFTTGEQLPFIAIDGENYDLALDDYSEVVDLRRRARRISELTDDERQEDLTEQEETELADLLQAAVTRMVRAPKEVLAKLTDLQRMGISNIYYGRAVEILDPTGELIGRFSPGSNDSTAGA